MDRLDPVSKTPVRRPLEEEVEGGDPHLAKDVDHTEQLESARDAEGVERDPEGVPNRVQEPEPPTEEEVHAKDG